MAQSSTRQAVYQKAMNSNEIYHVLKEDILNLNIYPGQMISENEIAALYHVSRTPVKIAFVRLESEGFIEVIPQKGTYVKHIDAKHIRDIVYMRYVLEVDMCKLALRTSNLGDLIEGLRENLSEQERIIAEPSLSPYAFYEVDSKFHHMLFTHTGKEQIWSVIQANQVHYTRFRILDTTLTARYSQLLTEHRHILKAIEELDEPALDKYIYKHMHSNLSHLEKSTGRHMGYLINN